MALAGSSSWRKVVIDRTSGDRCFPLKGMVLFRVTLSTPTSSPVHFPPFFIPDSDSFASWMRRGASCMRTALALAGTTDGRAYFPARFGLRLRFFFRPISPRQRYEEAASALFPRSATVRVRGGR